MTNARPYAVFLSHNSKDTPLIERLAQRLRTEGLAPWLDRWHLTPGGRWQDEIACGLDASGACAIFLGASGIGPWVQEELSLALDRAAKDRDFRLFLVLLPGLPEPVDTALVPPFLRARTWVDLRAGLDDTETWRALKHAITGRREGLVVPAVPSAATRDIALTALPIPPTPIIGRQHEIQAVVALLRQPEARLVTLTGPGGIGKTRLALSIATEAIDDFRDGLSFVPLAPLTDPTLVASTIAEELGVGESPGRTPHASLEAYLRDRHFLLVLDNFEQVSAAAPLVADLLAACGGLKILVTSRSALHLRGEHEFPVAPLALPDSRQPSSPAALATNDAVQLFVERARAIKPDFDLTDENAGAVATICRRLDGLPLALELAAARIRLLSPPALLARLETSLRLLTGGHRDLPARQQTLRSTIAWSYDLLSPSERRLFGELAVFVDGCTLDAAEAVCGSPDDPEADVLDGIEALISQSLMIHDASASGDSRFSMLQTIREFGLEQLDASGEGDTIRHRHATHYLSLALAGERALRGPRQAVWLARLDEEHNNLRGALRWATTHHQGELAVRLASTLWEFWELHGHLAEGIRWIEAGLALGGDTLDTALRADALNRVGMLLYRQGEQERAGASFAASLDLRTAIGDEEGVAKSLNNLGMLAQLRGEYTKARTYYERTLTIWERLGDPRGIGTTLNNLGIVAAKQGEYREALERYTRSLAIHRADEDHARIGNALNNLGRIAQFQGDYPAARAMFVESLSLRRMLGDRIGIATSLQNLALLSCYEGDGAHAVEPLEESIAICREVGDRRGIATALHHLALASHIQEAHAAAHRFGEEILALFRSLGDKEGIADALMTLGRVRVIREGHDAAAAHFHDAIAIAGDLGDRRRVAELVGKRAVVVARREEFIPAIRLWGAGEALRRDTGVVLAIIDRIEHANETAAARGRTDSTTWARVWEEGELMLVQDAVAYALTL